MGNGTVTEMKSLRQSHLSLRPAPCVSIVGGKILAYVFSSLADGTVGGAGDGDADRNGTSKELS